jgi:hypothetical protein
VHGLSWNRSYAKNSHHSDPQPPLLQTPQQSGALIVNSITSLTLWPLPHKPHGPNTPHTTPMRETCSEGIKFSCLLRLLLLLFICIIAMYTFSMNKQVSPTVRDICTQWGCRRSIFSIRFLEHTTTHFSERTTLISLLSGPRIRTGSNPHRAWNSLNRCVSVLDSGYVYNKLRCSKHVHRVTVALSLHFMYIIYTLATKERYLTISNHHRAAATWSRS